jgi:hypothetical protein
VSALGALRLRARLERPLPPSGDGTPAFEDVGGVWIAVTRVAAEDICARYTIVMRRHGAVAPGWRLALSDRRVRVLARVEDDGGYLTLDCAQDFA